MEIKNHQFLRSAKFYTTNGTTYMGGTLFGSFNVYGRFDPGLYYGTTWGYIGDWFQDFSWKRILRCYQNGWQKEALILINFKVCFQFSIYSTAVNKPFNVFLNTNYASNVWSWTAVIKHGRSLNNCKYLLPEGEISQDLILSSNSLWKSEFHWVSVQQSWKIILIILYTFGRKTCYIQPTTNLPVCISNVVWLVTDPYCDM